MKTIVLSALFASIILTGCTTFSLKREESINISTTKDSIFYKDLKTLNNNFKNKSFNINVISVADARGPSNFANDVRDIIIHEYRPEKLTIGLLPYLKGVMHKTLQSSTNKSKTYFAEYTLKDISTKIITGDFWSGKFGIYEAKITMDVVIRDKSSKVIVQKTFATTSTKNRKPAKGRHTNTKEDRLNMLTTLNNGLKKIALLSAFEADKKISISNQKHLSPLNSNSANNVYE